MFQKLSKTTFSSGKLWVRLALLAVLLTFVATLALFLASAKQATFFQLSKPEDKQASKPDDKKEEDCSCEAKAPPDVVAIVNGVRGTDQRPGAQLAAPGDRSAQPRA